jgi:hypothetical protein
MKHAAQPDLVNISGVDDEPLWVATNEIAAIGVRGKEDSMIVLRGGTQLVAKGMHPNEIIGLVSGADSSGE